MQQDVSNVLYFLPQKCIVLNLNDSVWAAKQLILDKIYHVSFLQLGAVTLFHLIISVYTHT